MKKYLLLMRPLDWVKNIFIFAALIFGRKIDDPISIGKALAGFICFSLASSAIYIFNDIMDYQTDKLHPEKSVRPIVSGKISITNAAILSIICVVVSVVGSFVLTEYFTIIIMSYIALMIFYSLFFKRMMILDCIIISIGFCLRAIAGAVIINVFISPWLIICTFSLCLFMAFCKRSSEIAALQENGELFRATLGSYTPELLSHMINVSSGIAVMCFLLYAMDRRTINNFGSDHLAYTTPLVLYCIFRFSALVQNGKSSDLTQIIRKDISLQIGFLLWILACIIIIYI